MRRRRVSDCWAEDEAPQGWLLLGDLSRIGEAEHVGMPGVRSLAFQCAVRIGQERGIEETEPEIALQRADHGDVAASVHIAGMAPFHDL